MELISSSLELFKRGDLMMYPLLLCSMMVVTIAVERYFYYRKADTDHKKLLPELTAWLNHDDWVGAKKVCTSAGGVTGMMLARGLG